MINLKKAERTLFFLCLLFLPTQLGKHFWPPFSLVYSLPVDYLSPTLFFWDLLVVGLVAVGFINFLKLKSLRINWIALNLWLLFILSLLPSLIAAKNLGASFVMLYRLVVSSVFGLYIAFKDLSEVKGQIFWGLGAGLLYESVIAVGEFLIGGSLNIWILGERSFAISTPSIATFNYLGQIFLRPYATFPHPNVLGAFLVVVMPLIWLFGSEEGHQKLVKTVSFVAGGVALFLTFSRSAIAVGFIEGFILLRRYSRWALIPLIIIVPILWVRYSSVFNFDNLSVLRREELDGIALIDFKQSPLFGIGLNNFINQTASSSLISGPTRFLQPVHNIFLLSLSETGLVGFFGFLLMVFIPIRRLWGKRSTRIGKTLLFIWGSIFLLGTVDHYFLSLPQGQRLLFMIWGLSMLQY